MEFLCEVFEQIENIADFLCRLGKCSSFYTERTAFCGKKRPYRGRTAPPALPPEHLAGQAGRSAGKHAPQALILNCLSSAPVQRTRPPAYAGGLVLYSAKNAKTGSAVERRRKRRCLSYENSQTFAVVRRWLVVCPPHWLLPRISGGQCFFKGGRSIGFLPRCAVFIACIGILREDRSFLPDCTLIVPDKNGVSL